jgi:hypothetical protein
MSPTEQIAGEVVEDDVDAAIAVEAGVIRG